MKGSLTASVPDCVPWVHAPPATLVTFVNGLVVSLAQEGEDGLCVRVEWEGEQEGIEEVKTEVADFHQPLQQAVQVAAAHLGGRSEREGLEGHVTLT